MLLAVTTVEVNVSSHGYYVSLSILTVFRYDQTLLFVVEEPRPYTGFEPAIASVPLVESVGVFPLNY